METNKWVARCSARLHAQWPRLQREQRDEVARDLWNDQRWQHSEPELPQRRKIAPFLDIGRVI